jgi:hypothetical protein
VVVAVVVVERPGQDLGREGEVAVSAGALGPLDIKAHVVEDRSELLGERARASVAEDGGEARGGGGGGPAVGGEVGVGRGAHVVTCGGKKSTPPVVRTIFGKEGGMRREGKSQREPRREHMRL